MSAHHSHVSWPHRSSTEGPSGAARMRPRHPFRHTPRTFCCLMGASPKDSSGAARMRPRHQFRRARAHFVAPRRPADHRRMRHGRHCRGRTPHSVEGSSAQRTAPLTSVLLANGQPYADWLIARSASRTTCARRRNSCWTTGARRGNSRSRRRGDLLSLWELVGAVQLSHRCAVRA